MSYITTHTYNPATEKVVPKDAVVLTRQDLHSFTIVPDGLHDRLLAYARTLENSGHSAGADLFHKIAEQTKPLRIPEPGKYGVVRDELGEEWVRAGATQISSIEWMNVETGTRLDFDDIPNPKLVRIGIES